GIHKCREKFISREGIALLWPVDREGYDPPILFIDKFVCHDGRNYPIARQIGSGKYMLLSGGLLPILDIHVKGKNSVRREAAPPITIKRFLMSASAIPLKVQSAHKGILLFCCAIFLFATMDAVAKYASGFFNPIQVVWARCFFHILLMVIILGPTHGRKLIRTNNLKMQVVRSILLLGATVSIFTAVKYIPLADAGAIGATSPFFVILLSAILLKEKVNKQKWIAVAVGFTGAMIVLRPGLAEVHPAMFLVLLMALCYALYQLTTRFLAGVDDSLTTAFYSVSVGTVVVSCIVPFFWTTPDLFGWGLLALVGLIGGVSHFIMIKAFEYTTASTTAPFNYTQLIWMTIIGLIFFGNFPDGFTILGAAIIVGSGLYVLYQERRQKQKQG
ncbi:MAG: hypothetical protein CMN55_14155, partial [Sneathiella sp.]|nr:hypothetical protein [Sneathiella sp.]